MNKTTEIETQLAYHDKSIEELSEMVTQQWKEIDRLKKLVGSLQDKVTELKDNIGDEDGGKTVAEIAAANKPPHY